MIHTLLSITRPLIVLDTETTGTDVNSDRIVEVGFQVWDATGMTKEWRSLVNPGVPIPAAATRVHGITDAEVNGCRDCGHSREAHTTTALNTGADPCSAFKSWPRFRDLATSLARGFFDCDYAGKNTRFDLRIVATEMQRAGQSWSYLGARIVDAERLEQLAVPRSLSHLHEKYVRKQCDECDGRGEYLDAPSNVLDGSTYMTKCHACDGTGTIGIKHDGAHGALSDVRASTTVIVHQLQAHQTLSRDLDNLHAAQWPGWIDGEGKFRFVDGVPCFSQWGKYANKPMRSAAVGYWDWLLKNDFSADVKALASAAKLGKFPEAT